MQISSCSLRADRPRRQNLNFQVSALKSEQVRPSEPMHRIFLTSGPQHDIQSGLSQSHLISSQVIRSDLHTAQRSHLNSRSNQRVSYLVSSHLMYILMGTLRYFISIQKHAHTPITPLIPFPLQTNRTGPDALFPQTSG